MPTESDTTYWPTTGKTYSDGRPSAKYSVLAEDAGIVLKHGDGPGQCDIRGAREAVVYKEDGLYHLFYDGAGSKGWLACLATSTDLVNWTKHGAVLELGEPGSPDSASASSPWAIFHDGWWHMFYLGTPNASPAPDYVPSFPYLTMKARARKLKGPWEKQYDVTPWVPKEGSWYSLTASPGYVIEHEGEFIQFMSGTVAKEGYENLPVDNLPPHSVQRSIGIARTKDLNSPWEVEDNPMVALEDQVENSSVYYEPTNQTWFVFTNHIGLPDDAENPREFTDAIWVYWSKDPLNWDPENKAVVVDGENCSWSKMCIGMPAIVEHEGRLAILFDAAGGESIDHMERDIGLAWLDLPLNPPA